MMEMMMMQNAQMQQLIMQQLMLSALPSSSYSAATAPAAATAGSNLQIDIEQLRSVKAIFCRLSHLNFVTNFGYLLHNNCTRPNARLAIRLVKISYRHKINACTVISCTKCHC